MKVTAVCERSGDWWAVRVPEVEGAFTQAKRLDQVPEMVADAVSLLAGVPADQVEVVLDLQESAAVWTPAVKDWFEAQRLQREAAKLQDDGASLARSSVRRLRQAGLSVRDIGVILQVSAQRVSQLAGGSGNGPRPGHVVRDIAATKAVKKKSAQLSAANRG